MLYIDIFVGFKKTFVDNYLQGYLVNMVHTIRDILVRSGRKKPVSLLSLIAGVSELRDKFVEKPM